MKSLSIIAACAALALAGCGGGEPQSDPAAEAAENETPAAETQAAAASGEAETAPEATPPAPQVDRAKLAAANLEEAKAFLAENAERDDVSETDSGLQYTVLEEGPADGASPEAADLVVVHYVGTLTNGEEFDSSRARGVPATFPLNQVIPGWTEGVQLMSEGDKFRFFIPPDLAYGERGTPGGPIGPNEPLIFDVELLKVQNPARNLEKSQAFLTENAKKDGVSVTESGLQYEVIEEGEEDGASPAAQDTVQVHYEGTLIDGQVFDSSYQRGEPAAFPLNRVIPGWTEGVQLMSVGDKYRFFIPPDLAYGTRGTPSIGPNEALIFEVELLNVASREEPSSDE